jgi:GNAT superfamily N-acetyltransferase
VIKVRPATVEDVDAVIELGLEFLETSIYRRLGAGEPDAIARLLCTVLDHGAVFLAVTTDESSEQVVGMIALLMVPHIFSGETFCDEVAWFVKPAHRGRAGVLLLHEAERWAVQNHAKLVKMVAPEGTTVGDLYRRKGYQVIETAFVKVLQHGDRHGSDSRDHRPDGARGLEGDE